MSFDFAKNLRVEMAKANMTNIDLAAKSRVSRSSISKYRNGELEPGSDIIFRLSKALECRIQDLFRE